jgi:hypothetical protein
METIIGIALAVLFVWLMWGSIPGGRVPERQDRFAASADARPFAVARA